MSYNPNERFYKAYGNTPSVKRMVEYLNIDKDTAKKIKAVLTGKTNLMDYKSARELEFQSYNPQDKLTLALYAIDELLNTCGVEYIESVDDTPTYPEGVEYCNTGDTYGATLIYDHRDGQWRIADIGTIIEYEQKRFEI